MSEPSPANPQPAASTPAPSGAETVSPSPPPKVGRTRLGRWLHRTKWTIRLAVGIPLVLAAATLLLMRSPLVGRVVGSQVRQLTGGQWRADHAVIALNGQLIVNGLSLRVPSVGGPAGELLSAREAEVEVDWWQVPPMRWVSSRPPAPVVRTVRLINPVFRLSQSTEDGSLNIGLLTPPPSKGGPMDLPRVDVMDGRMEFTEHSPETGRFDPLAVIPIAGSLMPSEASPTSFSVQLHEIGRAPTVTGAPRGMVLDGRVDLTAGQASVKLLNISLDAWPAESVPSRFRDLWRQLMVRGAVEKADFSYVQGSGLKVGLDLQDVALVVPVPAERPGDDDGFLSLQGVRGKIELSNAGLEADLEGELEQQGRSEVQLKTRGLEFDSGFECTIKGHDLSVTERPQFLPYVPPTVRKYLAWFGGPTAIVDGDVVIERGDPVDGRAAPVTVRGGRMSLRNGRAAFHKFPYPFHDLAGRVTFDDTTIRIVEITGVGPRGSPLRASALITPLTEDAEVDVKVDVTDVPIDEELLSVMQPGYRRLMELLFAREKHRDLVQSGMIHPPLPPPPEGGPGETSPDGRSFAFGGAGNVHVHLRRPAGKDVSWSTMIGVDFAEAGLVPEPFAFPIVARDLAIEINDNMAELKRGRFSGLHGGTAQVEAKVRFASGVTGEVEPDVRITARDVPVDDLLINAVPGREPVAGGGASGALNAKEILRRLDIRGQVDCGVTLSTAKRSDVPPDLVGPVQPPPVDYRVEVGLGNLTAAPIGALAAAAEGRGGGAESALCIRELSGSVVVTQDGVRIEGMRAGLGRLEAGAKSDTYTSATPAGEITLAMEAEALPATSADQGRLRARIGLIGLDLSDAFGPAVSVFSGEAAAFLSSMWETRRPAGVVDATVSLDSPRGPPGTPVQVGLSLESAASLSVQVLGGELTLEDPHGQVRVTTRDRLNPVAEDGERVWFDGVSGSLSFNGAPAGRFAVRGGFVRDPVDGGVARGDGLVCSLERWKFEGGLTQAILSEFGGESVSEGYQGLAPQGEFDAEVRLPGGGVGDGAEILSGYVRPRALQIVRRGQPIDFLRIGGQVNFRGEGKAGGHGRLADLEGVSGTIQDAGVVTEEWSARGGATWSHVPARAGERGGLSIDATFDAQVRQVGPQIRSVLPASADRTLNRFDLQFAQPVVIEGGRVSALLGGAEGGEGGAGDRIAFDGTVRFEGLSGDVGVPLKDATGSAVIHAPGSGVEGKGAAGDPVTVRIDGPGMRLAGVALNDYAMEAAWIGPGRAELRNATAWCHGGRVFASGSATWMPEVEHPDPPVTLRLNTLVAGVNFAPLLDDLAAAGVGGMDGQRGEPVGEEAGAAGEKAEPGASPDDRSRGTLDARFALEAVEGEPESRMGRGAIRVANGDVLRLPLILPLMQVSNLMLPSDDRLDYLQATFYLNGRRAVFDEVSVLSDTIAIVGGGSITMPAMDLDMRFNTKANRRIPLWSDVFEAVRDEIVSTTVTGTVEDPVVRSEPLTTTRRMLGDMVAPGQASWGKEQAEMARRERERVKRGG